MADDAPPPRGGVPLILWTALALVVVVAFIAALRLLNPPGPGTGPPTPDVIVPANPPAADLPDAEPITHSRN